MSILNNILIAPDKVDGLFCKVITANDDSGRHGVLIPASAYDLFPDIAGFVPDMPENYTENISTIWRGADGFVTKASAYKHYHRYPERRITSLGSKKLDNAPPCSMILFARHKDSKRVFEVHVFYPTDAEYQALANEFKLEKTTPGVYFLDRNCTVGSRITQSVALLELLDMFDEIKSRKFIKTLKRGPRGVGYTFETLMGIKENNDQRADYKGIEVKTFRSKELNMTGAGKSNLFLKEPTWKDGLSSIAERVKKYGYIDKNGRYALYSTVKIQENSHGLKFEIIDTRDEIEIEKKSVPVAFYPYSDIEKRLKEKNAETVFIAAQTKGREDEEEFYYRTLTYYINPTLSSFMELMASGDIMLELRMHINESGAVRNHGSAFRVTKNKLPSLFRTAICLRDAT